MHQCDDPLSFWRQDLAVFGKTGVSHERSKKVQDGKERQCPILGKNDCLTFIFGRSLSQFCEVILRNVFQYSSEGGFRNLHITHPLEEPVDICVGQEHLVDKGVEAHPVPCGTLLQSCESGLANPEG